ncbi:ferrochelatase [Puniceicoccaceae bacterium K14]|nr:ferrochelatase [Puniceicoccaceae bacterium K14]
MSKNAVLLVNLGSPDSTSVEDVRRYLDEFLSDDRVIDSPKIIQQIVVKGFILPKRPAESAKAYKKIWTDEGSPLIATSFNLQKLLQEQITEHVELGMRYGNPSIPSAIANLKSKGIENVFLVPLYPHYAMSSYETVVERVQDEVSKNAQGMKITTLQPFYDDPEYIDAMYQNAKPYLDGGYDKVLFSYHSIPVRHLKKADSSKAHCQVVEDCCAVCSPAHATCYKAQARATTEALAKRAGIPKDKYATSWQSRLTREPWITPSTDATLEELPKQGVKKLLVICPAFVSDCLETLEEIQMEGKEEFLEAGGEEFQMIPCLNEHPAWIRFLRNKTENWIQGL